jgi:hypothetical protein
MCRLAEGGLEIDVTFAGDDECRLIEAPIEPDAIKHFLNSWPDLGLCETIGNRHEPDDRAACGPGSRSLAHVPSCGTRDRLVERGECGVEQSHLIRRCALLRPLAGGSTRRFDQRVRDIRCGPDSDP